MANPKRERRATAIPAEPVGVWGLLKEAIASAPKPRPVDSVTASEYASATGLSCVHAGRLLRNMTIGDKPKLRAVPYLYNGKRAVCYVPAEAP